MENYTLFHKGVLKNDSERNQRNCFKGQKGD